MRYITDLTVLEGKNAEPRSGWTKIDKDLNADAGGAYLYFAYEEGDNPDRALTHIKFLVGQDQSVPQGHTKIDVDLNKGAHGKYIYTAFTREPRMSKGSPVVYDPIVGLDVIISDTSDVAYEDPWILINQDLNEGAKGKYVYLRYKHAPTEGSKGKIPFDVIV